MNRKQQEDAALENFKEEYGFDEIKDAFDEAAGPHQLHIFWGENNENFIRAIEFLSPSIENREFIAFLSFEKGQNVMTSNSLSMHMESANIFYQSFNINENFYSFISTQQDHTKALVSKRISYCHSFEKYIEIFLPSFSIDDVENFDLFANKNSKYLFYEFNDQIEVFEGEKRVIWHTVDLKNYISIRKIEERDRKFLVEKIINGVEFNNPYQNSIEKKPESTRTVENNYKISRRIYQSVFADVANIFIEHIHSFNQDEIFELNEDIKFNGWGAKHISEIEDA